MTAKMKNITKPTTAASGTGRPQCQRPEVASGIPPAPNRRDRRKAHLVPEEPSARIAPRTCTKLSDSPPSKPRAGAGPDHIVETMVRQLVARGIRLERVDTAADVSAAFSAFKRRGPAPKGPRLVKRRNGRIYVVDGTGCTTHREATPYRATPGENWRRHLGALAYLDDYIDRKVWTILRSPRRGTPHRGPRNARPRGGAR